MDSASRTERDPSALNFLFGVFLVIIVVLILIAAEASGYIGNFFLREVHDPSVIDDTIVIAALLAFFLLVFFIYSISFSSKFRR